MPSSECWRMKKLFYGFWDIHIWNISYVTDTVWKRSQWPGGRETRAIGYSSKMYNNNIIKLVTLMYVLIWRAHMSALWRHKEEESVLEETYEDSNGME